MSLIANASAMGSDDLGRRIRQMTASGGVTCPRLSTEPSAKPQVKPRLVLIAMGAPSRIRTCGSRLRRPPLQSSELRDLPARIRSLIPRMVKIIPRIFRIMETARD
jgi:hypothetical protein